MAARDKKPADKESAAYKAVLAALNAYSGPDLNADLLSNLNEVQAVQRELLMHSGTAAPHLATNTVLDAALSWLVGPDKLAADVLERRFRDGQTTAEVALALNESIDYVNRVQKRGVQALADYLWQRDAGWRARQIQALLDSLDSQPYSELIGVDALFAQAAAWLETADDDWIVVLHGIGGIGKTALADRIARHVLRTLRFAAVAQVQMEASSLNAEAQSSAQFIDGLLSGLYRALPDLPPAADREGRMRQIGARLRLFPHLVIIDNVERVEDAAALLPLLGQWARPSKFLVTTRGVPLTLPTGPVAPRLLALSELSAADAEALLRHAAANRQLDQVAAASTQQLRPVLDVTGGNPLAIKLTVGLASVLSLAEIITHLRRGETVSIEEMYARIYRTVWQTLSDPARTLLYAMAFAGSGGATRQQLNVYTELNSGPLSDAIGELTSRSLLEVRGSALDERRYTIHRLTETFLETDVIGWKI